MLTKANLIARARQTRNYATVAVSGYQRKEGIEQTVKELAELVAILVEYLPDDAAFPVEKTEANQ